MDREHREVRWLDDAGVRGEELPLFDTDALLEPAADLGDVDDEEQHDEPERGQHRGAVAADLPVADEPVAGDERRERERVDDGDEVRQQDDQRATDRGNRNQAGERADDDGVPDHGDDGGHCAGVLPDELRAGVRGCHARGLESESRHSSAFGRRRRTCAGSHQIGYLRSRPCSLR